MTGPRRRPPASRPSAPALALLALLGALLVLPGCALLEPGPGGEPSPAAAGLSAGWEYIRGVASSVIPRLERGDVPATPTGYVVEGAIALGTAVAVGAAAMARQKRKIAKLREAAKAAAEGAIMDTSGGNPADIQRTPAGGGS